MSSVIGRREPTRGNSAPLPARTKLAVVPERSPTRRSRAFPATVMALMAAGLVGLLLVNIAMQNTAFELAQLTARADHLHVRQQKLQLEVDRLGSPEHLAQVAQAQGMVPNLNPVFLDLATGKVVGTPTPAPPGPGPAGSTLVPEPTPQQSKPLTPPRRSGPVRGGQG